MIRTKVGTYVKRTTDEFIAIAKKFTKIDMTIHW